MSFNGNITKQLILIISNNSETIYWIYTFTGIVIKYYLPDMVNFNVGTCKYIKCGYIIVVGESLDHIHALKYKISTLTLLCNVI